MKRDGRVVARGPIRSENTTEHDRMKNKTFVFALVFWIKDVERRKWDRIPNLVTIRSTPGIWKRGSFPPEIKVQTWRRTGDIWVLRRVSPVPVDTVPRPGRVYEQEDHGSGSVGPQTDYLVPDPFPLLFDPFRPVLSDLVVGPEVRGPPVENLYGCKYLLYYTVVFNRSLIKSNRGLKVRM